MFYIAWIETTLTVLRCKTKMFPLTNDLTTKENVKGTENKFERIIFNIMCMSPKLHYTLHST